MKATLRLNPSKRLGIEGKEGDEIEVTEEMAVKLRREGVIYSEAEEAELKAIKKNAPLTGEAQSSVTVPKQELKVDEKGKK